MSKEEPADDAFDVGDGAAEDEKDIAEESETPPNPYLTRLFSVESVIIVMICAFVGMSAGDWIGKKLLPDQTRFCGTADRCVLPNGKGEVI